ncbi:MAG TPA: hypothetical protein PL041_07015 [Melioribacteraceae bacterium]|nr:hypothetical protein [Melioribacteraceae bacterium]
MNLWVNSGIGINNSKVLAFGSNINVKTFSFYSQIGFQKISRLVGGVDDGNVKGELTSNAINLGVGLLLQKNYYYGAFFVGPAVVFGDERGNKIIEENITYQLFNKSKFVTLGITFNSQFFVYIYKNTALGLELYGVLNNKRSMAEIKTSVCFYLNYL